MDKREFKSRKAHIFNITLASLLYEPMREIENVVTIGNEDIAFSTEGSNVVNAIMRYL